MHYDHFKPKSYLKLIKKNVFSEGEQFPLKRDLERRNRIFLSCFESRTARMTTTYEWAYVVVTLIWPTRVWRAPLNKILTPCLVLADLELLYIDFEEIIMTLNDNDIEDYSKKTWN